MTLLNNILSPHPDLKLFSLSLFLQAIHHFGICNPFLETVLPPYLNILNNELNHYASKPNSDSRKLLLTILGGLTPLLAAAFRHHFPLQSQLIHPSVIKILLSLFSRPELTPYKKVLYPCLAFLAELFFLEGENVSPFFSELELSQLSLELEAKSNDETTMGVMRVVGVLMRSGERRVVEWLRGSDLEWRL